MSGSRRLLALVKEVVQGHFQCPRKLLQRLQVWDGMAVLNAGDVTANQTSARFDVTLGEVLFLAYSTQAVRNNHVLSSSLPRCPLAQTINRKFEDAQRRAGIADFSSGRCHRPRGGMSPLARGDFSPSRRFPSTRKSGAPLTALIAAGQVRESTSLLGRSRAFCEDGPAAHNLFTEDAV